MSHRGPTKWPVSIRWDGNQLRLSSGRRVLATLEPDQQWPGLWRVRLPNGSVSDMVNKARARDAARTLALMDVRKAA